MAGVFASYGRLKQRADECLSTTLYPKRKRLNGQLQLLLKKYVGVSQTFKGENATQTVIQTRHTNGCSISNILKRGNRYCLHFRLPWGGFFRVSLGCDSASRARLYLLALYDHFFCKSVQDGASPTFGHSAENEEIRTKRHWWLFTVFIISAAWVLKADEVDDFTKECLTVTASFGISGNVTRNRQTRRTGRPYACTAKALILHKANEKTRGIHYMNFLKHSFTLRGKQLSACGCYLYNEC